MTELMSQMSVDETHPALIKPLFFDPVTYQFCDSPKKLLVEVVNVHRACELNALWHSRFPIVKWGNVVRNKRYVCFQASDDQLVYAVALWSSPIAANRLAEGEKMLELRRMAIAPYAPKNTATFMLKKMRQWVFTNFTEIETLISYQDTEAHHGTIYKADNWKQAATSNWSDWSKGKRQRSAPQSAAAKVRWEYRKNG